MIPLYILYISTMLVIRLGIHPLHIVFLGPSNSGAQNGPQNGPCEADFWVPESK